MTRKPFILCVDDRSSLLEGRQMLLEENGYKVLIATNGKDAVDAFASNPVDLVLIDCHMPQMDGGETAMQMKACKPDVPIALLSGDDWLPPCALEAVDAFISQAEPMRGLLEKASFVSAARWFVG